MILSRHWVIVDGVWVGNRIYWTLKQLVTTPYKLLSQRLIFPLTVVTALLGNVFQQWTFLYSRPHILAGRLLSHNKNRLCYATAYNNGGPLPPTPPLRATFCDDLRRLCLSTADCRLTNLDPSRLTDLSVWYSWYSRGTDPTENTASNSSSFVAWLYYRRGPTENTAPSRTPIGCAAWHEVFHCCITLYCAIT
jgi:hypothetical protein